ncbi:recombinase RecT [Streptomyces sp. NPDC047070]|uniref:recombinase RecT n=1 Tax=Streptomyces sp. NPDC047070 TaxID=3154923 RepID=UPI00345198DD
MTTDLKSRLRAARSKAEGIEQHDQAPDAPAELGDVKGHEDAAPPMSKTVMGWLAKYSKEFDEALPRCVDRGTFFAAVRAALPTLSRCTPASTLQALLTCARFGLLPDGTEAVVKRQGTTAVFVPMYQGYIQLMHRSGEVGSVHVGEIRENDEVSFTPTAPAPDDFVHKVDIRKDRGEVTHVYAFGWMAGGARSAVVMLSKADAESIRDEYSEAYAEAKAAKQLDSSFWHTHFLDMWKKSAVRRLFKLMPKSAELNRLADADDAGDAGQAQILHAPDPESGRLLAEAEAAAQAAEASQEPVSPKLARKRAAARRSRGKRQRGGVKAGV